MVLLKEMAWLPSGMFCDVVVFPLTVIVMLLPLLSINVLFWQVSSEVPLIAVRPVTGDGGVKLPV